MFFCNRLSLPFRSTAVCPLVRNFTFAPAWDDVKCHLDLLSVTAFMTFSKPTGTMIMNIDTKRTYSNIPVTFKAVSDHISCFDALHAACAMMKYSTGKHLSFAFKSLMDKGFTSGIIVQKCICRGTQVQIRREHILCCSCVPFNDIEK